MEVCITDYLTNIPDELKIEIFSYLCTYDVIQLSQISFFEHLSLDKHLISNISLFKEYRFGINQWKGFVLNKLRSEIITSLNINCVYWIPAFELRKCFEKLHMLEAFYAVDTQLGMAPKDTIAYSSLPHLKTIALTVSNHELETDSLRKFPLTITNLYLHLDVTKSDLVTKLSIFISKLKQLEELWIIDVSPHFSSSTCMRILCLLPTSVKKLTLMIHSVSNLALINSLSFNGVLSFRSFKVGAQMSYERFDQSVEDIYSSWKFRNDCWDILLNRLKCDPPFSVADAKRLILGQATPDDLQYEELNMSHTASLCNELLKSTLGTLLLGTNMTLLKKLSINFCLCEQEGDDVAKKEEPLFKRARCGVSNSLANKSVLEKIIENSPSIEELELWECESALANTPNITNGALSAIQNMTNLKKLTLQGIPQHLEGRFLVDICKGCTNLTSLRIQIGRQNSNLNNFVSLALPYATALKDFRYCQPYIALDKLFESLNEIENFKLERMVLKCRSIEKFSVAPFEAFLISNQQLRFLCIVITEISNTVIRNILNSANRYKSEPQKIFVVSQDESNYIGRFPIPHIYKREMISCTTSISVLDIFNGFTKS